MFKSLNQDGGFSVDKISASINTNTRKACFWMFAYMIYTPDLIDIIRKETAPAFANGSVDVHYLNEKCPQLTSVWMETIRMSAFSASVRYVVRETTIGGKILRRGNRVVIPYR